jgi:hypothetical protein
MYSTKLQDYIQENRVKNSFWSEETFSPSQEL